MLEDLRAALEEIASDPSVTFIPVVSTCVAETAGIAEELLPRKAGNAEVLLVRLPAFELKTHPEAKDVTLSTLLGRFADFHHLPGVDVPFSLSGRSFLLMPWGSGLSCRK